MEVGEPISSVVGDNAVMTGSNGPASCMAHVSMCGVHVTAGQSGGSNPSNHSLADLVRTNKPQPTRGGMS